MLISLWFGLQQKQNSALFLLQRLEVLFIDTYWSTKCVVLLHLPPSLCHAHLQAFPLSSHIYHAVLTSQNFISFDRVPVCISILGLLLLLSSASWSILFIIIFIFYFAVVFWCFHALVLCCCLFLSAMLHSSVLHLAVHRFLSLSLFFSLFFFSPRDCWMLIIDGCWRVGIAVIYQVRSLVSDWTYKPFHTSKNKGGQTQTRLSM